MFLQVSCGQEGKWSHKGKEKLGEAADRPACRPLLAAIFTRPDIRQMEELRPSPKCESVSPLYLPDGSFHEKGRAAPVGCSFSSTERLNGSA